MSHKCTHCLDQAKNAIDEDVAYCELCGEWKNITLGDCFGNCESQHSKAVVIPKHIREKMHKIADLHSRAADLSAKVDNWFTEHGFDVEELRDGSGISLEELDYGNDVTDAFCRRVENGDFVPTEKG